KSSCTLFLPPLSRYPSGRVKYGSAPSAAVDCGSVLISNAAPASGAFADSATSSGSPASGSISAAAWVGLCTGADAAVRGSSASGSGAAPHPAMASASMAGNSAWRAAPMIPVMVSPLSAGRPGAAAGKPTRIPSATMGSAAQSHPAPEQPQPDRTKHHHEADHQRVGHPQRHVAAAEQAVAEGVDHVEDGVGIGELLCPSGQQRNRIEHAPQVGQRGQDEDRH